MAKTNSGIEMTTSSLFGKDGYMRKGDKAPIVHKLASWAGTHQPLPPPDVLIVDGNQLLYRIQWTSTIPELASNLVTHCRTFVPTATLLVVVFDRYMSGSIKTLERDRRRLETSGDNGRNRLLRDTPSKIHLIENLVRELVHKQNVIIGGGWQEEADCNIIQCLGQCLATGGVDHVQVLTDDTDVFVLLLYFWSTVWKTEMPHAWVTMRKRDRRIVVINDTVQKLGECYCKQLPGFHALTGCDTVSYLPRKGKVTALHLLDRGVVVPNEFGERRTDLGRVLEIGRRFLRHLYTGANWRVFLATLHARDNVNEHIKRAHLQTVLWKEAASPFEPSPAIDISQWGWTVTDNVPRPTRRRSMTEDASCQSADGRIIGNHASDTIYERSVRSRNVNGPPLKRYKSDGP